MKKILWGTAVVVIVLLGEGVYAHLRIGAALGGSGQYFKVHAVNDIWLHVVLSTTFLFLGLLGIWGTRVSWKWEIKRNVRENSRVLAVFAGNTYRAYRPEWLSHPEVPPMSMWLLVFHSIRVVFTLLSIAVVGFCLVFLLASQFLPAYEELGLDSETIVNSSVYLFPRPVERLRINWNEVEWLEYTSPDQGIAMLGGEEPRTLIFEDFTIEQHVADSIAAALGKPLESVDQIE